MPEQSGSLRSELPTATRMLAAHRLIGMFGHVSVLTEDPQRYLVCPGAGARKDRCRSADVLELDLDHEFEPGLPLELYMHSEVHRLKPHIRSLIHVHSPALAALGASARGRDKGVFRWRCGQRLVRRRGWPSARLRSSTSRRSSPRSR